MGRIPQSSRPTFLSFLTAFQLRPQSTIMGWWSNIPLVGATEAIVDHVKGDHEKAKRKWKKVGKVYVAVGAGAAAGAVGGPVSALAGAAGAGTTQMVTQIIDDA